MGVKTSIRAELIHLHKTRKNDIKVCIYQEFERGIEYWVYLDEFEREDIQKELEESNILNLISLLNL